MTTLPESKPSQSPADWLKSAAWLFYLAVGLEILFMISPAALYFYSLYGPALNALDHFWATAWLTQFFLPHISTTRSLLLNALPGIGGFLATVGAVWFLAAAGQLYWSKFHRRGLVTTGLYGLSRHPQYTGLALFGLGALLLWPRFLVLIAYVAMLFLYRALAALEERRCVEAFGEAYRDYQARTRPILPIAPESLGVRWVEIARTRLGRIPALPIVATALAVVIALGLREYALTQITAFYENHSAVLSPALLSDRELRSAYRTALADAGVWQAITSTGTAPLVVHVLPQEWYLADLPLDAEPMSGGHHTPATFDRRHYKLLFSRARTHEPRAVGKDIIRSAHGLNPFLLASVDIAAGTVSIVETPPAYVRWGDIPTPLF
ncbi:methyltransferase family protein [Methylococcus geothermalis]|uniref:DUF1295 domain-containing protein n=1 Tax=Methylococcus geothermalis TaxID=2681310 RepID=A0A858QB26_9GAMM|nr:methyltransferase [Methylococcus geothermalis]QJD30904.1 DUF1295 domain-containing protein [Methylococcus geothermalis]